jgi:CopG family transcriptional regulator/antitoxin EndoAI
LTCTALGPAWRPVDAVILGGASVSESKRIIVSLPDSLLKEVDSIVSLEKKNRSEFIREAMKLYIRERQKMEIREQLKKGYMEMAAINLALAEQNLVEDGISFGSYESRHAEGE